MIRVLVTGMSGTGKSTVLVELGQRGHRVVDTDYGGWSEDVPSFAPSGVDREPAVERRWREDRMTVLLAQDGPGILFVSGCVSNQGRFYRRFDAVVLLSVPVDVLLERITRRVTNSFGRGADERARILGDVRTVEPLLRSTATAEVDTNRSLGEVVDDVETIARHARNSVYQPPAARRAATESATADLETNSHGP